MNHFPEQLNFIDFEFKKKYTNNFKIRIHKE